MSDSTVLIVGAGIFGATAAWALVQRGHSVCLLDPGPIPHPKASSTDISKLIRMDYGEDLFYAELMEASFEGWRHWNTLFDRPMFHEVGALMLTTEKMQSGRFESDSYQVLKQRGHPLERMSSRHLSDGFPAWNSKKYTDGYFNPVAGWAESGAVTEAIVRFAQAAGVQLVENCVVESFLEEEGRVTGVMTTDRKPLHADAVILAAGAWSPAFLPELSQELWPVALPIMHFRPSDPSLFRPPSFLPWAADISRTGWYGFPANADGILKIANHGPGVRIDPVKDSRTLHETAEEEARTFFRESIPPAADLAFVGGRLCLYCDTFDGDFLITQHPDRPGLTIATGGSGHGFKFAPMLGDIIADVLEAKPNPYAERFAWRKRSGMKTEQARFDG